MSRTASQRATELIARASHAREQAISSGDDRSRAFWFAMEMQWLSRARVEIEIAEQVEFLAGRRAALREEMRERLEREISTGMLNVAPPTYVDALSTPLPQQTEDLRASSVAALSIALQQPAEDFGTADAEAPSLAPPQYADDIGAADAEIPSVVPPQETEDLGAAEIDATSIAHDAEDRRTTRPGHSRRRRQADEDAYDAAAPAEEAEMPEAAVVILSDYRHWREFRTPLGR